MSLSAKYGVPLCEHGTPEAFEKAVAKRLGIHDQWGLATMDDGIHFVAPTRRRCFQEAGIVTKYQRRMTGRYRNIYTYESEGGTTAHVGAVSSLVADGFSINVAALAPAVPA